MRVVDPRLLRHARAARSHLIVTVLLGLAVTGLISPVRRALTADLLRATEGRSVLLITHEPDVLDQVGQIVVLDRGRVTEQGSHQQLRHAGGPYQRMWENDYEPAC